MPFVPQSQISSSKRQLLARTHPLIKEIPQIKDLLRAYHDEFPHGKDYTLRVFQRLGEDRVRKFGKNFRQMKRNIGIFVPQMLVQIYGTSKVSTERRDNGNAWNRSNDDPATKSWVKTYTRHRVK